MAKSTKQKLIYRPSTLAFISLALALLVVPSASQPVSINKTAPEAIASLSLSSPTLNLTNQEKFTLSINYHTSTPAHFIQALIKFDPQLLKPILPATKKHSLPLHAEKLLDNNTLRISAAGVDPNQPGKILAQTFGQHDFATVEFNILPTKLASTTIELITNQENDSDWQSSVIVYVNKQQKPVNLLKQTNSLTFTLNSSQEDIYQTFAPVATEASLIAETTTTSASLEATSSTALESPLPTPPPPPSPPQLSLWQKFLNYFKSLFKQIGI